MRNQEIYDKVRAHLLKQRVKAENNNGCLYRGPNHTKCAVGCLIADEDYSPDMEGPTLGTINSNDPSAKKVWIALRNQEISSRSYDLLRNLQSIHDGTEPEYWERDLNVVAKHFRLKVND